MKILGKIPQVVYLGFSGGSDSVFALTFLANTKRDVTPLIFDHGTGTFEEAEKTYYRVRNELYKKNIPAMLRPPYVKYISNPEAEDGMSMEQHWREERYVNGFFTVNAPVITAHHLNDVAENWLITGTRTGNPRLIPYRNRNVIRPFLAVSKDEIFQYLHRQGISDWYEDPSNQNVQYLRARIRHNVLPEVLKGTPGFLTTIRKRVVEQYENTLDYE